MFEEGAPEEGRQDGLDPLAAAELKEQTVTWHAKVIAEAGRLAAGRHAGTQREPITPHDIARAVHNVDGLPAVHKQSWHAVAFYATSYVATALAGFFGNNMDESWGAIGFAITATLGALTAIGALTGWYGEQTGRRGRR
jgi:hypothetical protein